MNKINKLCISVVLLAATMTVHAQTAYPTRAVRLIVPSSPGGGTDISARILAPQLTQFLGQQVVVENRPGAGTMIGGEAVARAAPDGYTLLMGISTLAINPAMYKKVPYDALKDLAPISQAVALSNVLVIHPSLPSRNLKEFIAFAKARPGQINFASAGKGTSPHLSMELFLVLAKLKMLHVPYKGSGPGVTDLIAGHVPVMMPNMLSAQPHIKSGRIRALGVTGTKRAPGADDIPTIAEAGVPGYEAVQWYGVLAPAATPRDIITKLHAGVVRALQNPDVRQRLLNDGAEPVGSSPEQFGAYIRAETEKWAKVIKAAGMTKRRAAVSPLMQTLAGYIAAAPRRALPAAVTERAKHHLLDTLSAMLSGSRLLPGRRAIEFIKTQGGVPEATVIGSNIVTTAINAALANGMHAHADETDDTYYLALVHPGCGVVPAALALAERERAGGTTLLRALVLGYDVCARMSMALGIERFRERGHSTHSFGHMFGAAAAAAAIMKLNVDQTRYLLSYTAQQASGLSCWARDIEHIEKAFDFGGMPARNGVTAALMASMKFTGVEDVFDGDRSFFHAHGLTADPKKLIQGLGKTWEIMNTSIKRWAIGYPIQAPIDAVLNIMEKHHITASDVEAVVITIDEQGARTVNQRTMASINIQHLTAVMLLDGDITFASAHDNRRVRDPRVLAIKNRITLQGSAALGRAKTTQAIVEITTRDGRRLRHHTKAVRGTAANPMPRAEVEAKSRDLLLPVIGARRTARLIDTVWNIERLRDARALRQLLAVK